LSVYIAMLRGINLGGNNIIRMAELRDLCCELGLIEPETVVQSGNIVFRAPRLSAAKVATVVSDGIQRRLGFRPETIVRTVDELQSTIARNPFADRMNEINTSKLLVLFFGHEPASLPAFTTQINEELHLIGKELYVYYPEGMGRSKLGLQLDRLLKAYVPTARNWNTVTKLLQMAERKV